MPEKDAEVLETLRTAVAAMSVDMFANSAHTFNPETEKYSTERRESLEAFSHVLGKFAVAQCELLEVVAAMQREHNSDW